MIVVRHKPWPRISVRQWRSDNIFVLVSSGGSRPSDRVGAGHPEPEIRGGPGLQKRFFRPFGPHFGLKIRGWPWPPGPLPGSATGLDNTFAPFDLINRSQSISGWSCSVSLLILTNNPLQRETTWATPPSAGNSLVVLCCLYLPPPSPQKNDKVTMDIRKESCTDWRFIEQN